MIIRKFGITTFLLIFVTLVNGQAEKLNNEKLFLEKDKIIPSWKSIKLDDFSLKIPYKMKRTSDKGIDSPFRRYTSDENALDISIGQYVGFQKGLRDEAEYKEEIIKIGKANALICFYKLDEPIDNYLFVSRFFLLEENGAKFSISMTLYSNELSEDEKEIARTIFKSIKFR